MGFIGLLEAFTSSGIHTENTVRAMAEYHKVTTGLMLAIFWACLCYAL